MGGNDGLGLGVKVLGTQLNPITWQAVILVINLLKVRDRVRVRGGAMDKGLG